MLVSDWLMPRVTCMWPCLGSDLTARLLQLYPARSIFAYKDLPDIPAVWPQSVILYPMTRSSSLGANSCVLEPWESLRTNREIDTALHQILLLIAINTESDSNSSPWLLVRDSVSGSWSALWLRTRLLVLNRIGREKLDCGAAKTDQATQWRGEIQWNKWKS